jgi:hypothetical protein
MQRAGECRRSHIADCKRPREFRVAAIRRTPSGKMQKQPVRQTLQQGRLTT